MTRSDRTRLFTAALVFAVLFAFPALAGPTTERGNRQAGNGQAVERLREMLDSLGLTDDQKKQTDQVIQEAQEDLRAMAKDLKGASPSERREKIAPVIKSAMEKIRSILTDDQKAELRQKMQERREQRREESKGGEKRHDKGDEKKTPNAEILPPTSQPSAGGVPRGPMLQRVRDRLAGLDLTSDQQVKIDAVLDDAALKFQQIRQSNADGATDTRDKAKLLMQATRSQIAAILTPEQKAKWQAAVEPKTPPPDSPKDDAISTPDTTAVKAAAASLSPAPLPATKPADTKALYQGAPAPPFRLKRLGGSEVTLDSFSGKPIVLIFGSYTSPTFRDKAGQIDALTKRYRGRAAVLIVYTREAYPANEWETQRNQTEQIKIEQHRTLAERQQMAKMTQDGLKITTDIAVDDIDDGVTDAYDGVPNAAYVLFDGKIVKHQKWADPLGLAPYIDGALKKQRQSN